MKIRAYLNQIKLFLGNQMESKIVPVSEALTNLESVRDVLVSGGVIAVPTDTIYGLACLARNTAGLNKIYAIKGRSMTKPLALAVGKTTDLERWSKVTLSDKQLGHLLPGPVTLVLERKTTLPVELNPLNQDSIGIRIPDNEFMIKLAQMLDEPIALTSANISNQPSSLDVTEFKSLWNDLDMIIDGGRISDSELSKAGSTVIDLTSVGSFRIIRKGSEYKRVLSKMVDDCQLTEINNNNVSI